jgi:hypothetical protein
MGNGRDFVEGWLSPWSRNLMMIVGYGLVVLSVVMIRHGVVSNDFAVIVEGLVVGFVGWLISTLVPDPVPAPRKPMRRRAAKLARVGGHLLP